jgi:hypothetical protein
MKFAILILILGAAGFGVTRLVGGGSGAASPDDFQTTYYASGQIESKFEYEGGKREGSAERWYANGKRMAEGRYKDGRMEGAWQFWNADGSSDAARTGTYKAGERMSESESNVTRGE